MGKMLRVDFQIVTPLVLSGADQRRAELRLPSVKGMLRYWYRAVDPEYNQKRKLDDEEKGSTWENSLFGGTGAGEGQSCFLMRLHSKNPAVRGWKKRIDLSYLAFSLEGKRGRIVQEPRGYLEPNNTFSLSFCMRPSIEAVDQYWRRLIAAIWLLGHVGGLGYRSRRGFGSVALKSWRVDNPLQKGGTTEEIQQVIRQLPIAHGAGSVHEWLNQFERGLRTLKGEKGWFPRFSAATHTVIDESIFLIHSKGFSKWEEALAYAGSQLKGFRKEIDIRKRTVFGMPMLVPQRKIQYTPEKVERMASPVWIRVVEAGGCYFPMFGIYRTPPLKAVEKPMGKHKGNKSLNGRPFLVPFKEVLDEFQNHLRRNEFTLEVHV